MSEYTREQILAMEAGRELDALIAESVMGWKECAIEGWRTKTAYGKPAHFGENEPRVRINNYSNNISDIWEVEEEIAELHLEGRYIKALCDVTGTPKDGTRHFAIDDWQMVHATPEQRSKAALLAVMNL